MRKIEKEMKQLWNEVIKKNVYFIRMNVEFILLG